MPQNALFPDAKFPNAKFPSANSPSRRRGSPRSEAYGTKFSASGSPAGRERVAPSCVVVSQGRLALVRVVGTGLVGAVMFLLASAAPAPAGAAEATPPQREGACQQEPHRPATPPARGADSGTMPGNAGSTGWTGGSHPGLTPQAGTPGSPDRQPEVVTGLDPKAPQQRTC